MKTFFAFFAICLVAFSASGQDAYRSEVEKWRAEHEANLKSETGWLTLAGLFWLKPGTNTIGSGDGFDIGLTENFKAGKFGSIEFDGSNAVLTVESGINASVGEKPIITALELLPDGKGKPTVVQTGSQSFYLIKRENRYGIRLKDRQTPKLKTFNGLHWYPVDESFRITADFESFSEPKEVLVPNVFGGEFRMKSPGLLKFRINGKVLTLQPVVEEGEKKLFIIFRDLSSKKHSYAAGRFLYTDLPVNGKVVLDFNKAENPPCAYTPFATCPLPPVQNRLNIEIAAGEKKFDH
jgi:uncharacterized protein (DUF1684 family)